LLLLMHRMHARARSAREPEARAGQVLAVALAGGGLCLAACGREDFWDEEADAAHEGGGAAAASLRVDASDEETPVLPALRVRLREPLAGGRPVRCAPAGPACAPACLQPPSASSAWALTVTRTRGSGRASSGAAHVHMTSCAHLGCSSASVPQSM